MSRALAAVFAHPDDETFGCGGTLARYAAEGVRCSLFCATDGDAGRTSGEHIESRQMLGRRRREELGAAASALGISTVRSVGHPDGELGLVDADLLIGEVARFIREQRQHVVLGVGPEGAPTGHRDHRAISRVATAAFHLAGLSTAYPEHTESALERWQASRLYYVSWPAPGPDDEFQREAVPATARIAVSAYDERRREAFRAHATQRDHEERFERLSMLPHEWFALAAGVPQPAEMVEDLFAGLQSASGASLPRS